MLAVLSAGTAVVLFAAGLVALGLDLDRGAGWAELAGLLALSVAVLAHVAERRNR